MAGACPFWDKISAAMAGDGSVDFSKINAPIDSATHVTPTAYFVSNVTYFYPVLSEFSYKLHYKPDLIMEVFEKVHQEKNTFSAEALYTKLFSLEGAEHTEIEVVIGPGNRDKFSDLDINALKENIRKNFLHTMLEKIGTPVYGPPSMQVVPPPEDPHIKEFRTRYQCETKSSFFGFSKKQKCWSTVYEVKIPVTGISNTVSDFINKVQLDMREEVKVFNTVIRQGSYTFTE
jgi:hypothetical protein